MINPIRVAIKHLERVGVDSAPAPEPAKTPEPAKKTDAPAKVTQEEFEKERQVLPSQAMLGFTEAFFANPATAKVVDPNMRKMISLVKSLGDKTKKLVGDNRGKAADTVKDAVTKAFGEVKDLPEDEQALIVLKAFEEAWRVITSAMRASLPDDSSKDEKKLFVLTLNWKPTGKGDDAYFSLAKTFKGLAPSLAAKLPGEPVQSPQPEPPAEAGPGQPAAPGKKKKPAVPAQPMAPDQERKLRDMFIAIKGKKGRWSEQPVRDWFAGQIGKARMSQRSKQFYSSPRTWRGTWNDFKNLAMVVSAGSLVSDYSTLARLFDKVK